MIDAFGRPVSWLRRSYADTQDIRFSDLNNDGRLEWTDTRYGPSNRNIHHYWTSALYEARDAHWYLISGPHGSATRPQFVQYTNFANRRPFRLTEAEKPPVVNIGSAPSFAGTVTVREWLPPRPRPPWKPMIKGVADYYFRLQSLDAERVVLSNGETCFLNGAPETVLERPSSIEWIAPTRKAIGNNPLDLTVTRHKDLCRIERIVIHAP